MNITLTDTEQKDYNKFSKREKQIRPEVSKIFKKHLYKSGNTFIKSYDPDNTDYWYYTVVNEQAWKEWFMIRNYPANFDKRKAMADCLAEIQPLLNEYETMCLLLGCISSGQPYKD